MGRRRAKPTLPASLRGLAALTAGEGDKSDIVVCLSGDDRPSFADDVHTTCASCGVNIYHRPYMPVKATKVCAECALRLLRKGAAS